MKAFRKYLALCCASSFLLLPDPSSALDLTPGAGLIQGNEGNPTPTIQFTDGKKKILWVAPTGWLASGGPTSASLSAPDGSGAWIKLQLIKKNDPQSQPQAQPTPDASAPQEDLQAFAMRFVPPGSKDVTFVRTVPSPFLLNGRPSSEFIFTFARYGSRDSISISVVEYSATERLVVLVSAAGKDFEKVRSMTISSLFSWRELK